jgi:hypothetical protein
MTTRAADHFDAIRARMNELAGKPWPSIKSGDPGQILVSVDKGGDPKWVDHCDLCGAYRGHPDCTEACGFT